MSERLTDIQIDCLQRFANETSDSRVEMKRKFVLALLDEVVANRKRIKQLDSLVASYEQTIDEGCDHA